MIKYAVIFLVVSLLAGAVGFTNVSDIARRISLILFGLFFLGFLLLVGLAMLVDRSMESSMLPAASVLLPA